MQKDKRFLFITMCNLVVICFVMFMSTFLEPERDIYFLSQEILSYHETAMERNFFKRHHPNVNSSCQSMSKSNSQGHNIESTCYSDRFFCEVKSDDDTLILKCKKYGPLLSRKKMSIKDYLVFKYEQFKYRKKVEQLLKKKNVNDGFKTLNNSTVDNKEHKND